MNLHIICHYTFFSNEINPFAAFIMLLLMTIFLIFGIRIWIGNKVDDYKLNKETRKREDSLAEEAEYILSHESIRDEKLDIIKHTYNWKNWFIKGYIEGATNGNSFHSPFAPYKPKSEFTVEEWKDFRTQQMQHIKEDSDYFGGDKKTALYAYFIGHMFGCKNL
ncbi:hypothetical protein [uncultured Muribaculum sp.]|uniref:hypothetical protein n=1 Tax=uncultured Muribaculum sp. TaxID=1918613 RepID=UPI002615A911|nr:hypothetical protein [uncultured Muribaculum sp.]